jgi:hypothetical protein
MRSLLVLSLLVVAACAAAPTEEGEQTSEAAIGANGLAAQSAIPDARLAAMKTALPKVAFKKYQAVLDDPETFWYDHDSMAPSYQETGSPGGGARDNAHWRDLIADTGVNDVNSNPATGAEKIYDNTLKHWKFPVAVTAGTDEATNITIVDFIRLPKDAAGKRLSIPISTTSDNIHLSWQWQYPNGTIVGEVMFIKDGAALLPCEVRFRERYAAGWATNAYRPFPEATSLSAAIKTKRPQLAQNAALAALVARLDGAKSFTPKRLTAAGLTGTFDQSGALDVLPDFGDAALVRDLLKTTTFQSAYGAVWATDGTQKTFAASTASELSIVPKNYTAGLVEVNETSCMRCHKEGGRKLDEFYPGLTLYGEVWGKDGIFTFHPFDESYYSKLDLDEGAGIADNRHMNPKLVAQGMIEARDPQKHTGPAYERR